MRAAGDKWGAGVMMRSEHSSGFPTSAGFFHISSHLADARLSDAGFEPRLAKRDIQPAVPVHTVSGDVHCCLEPREVSLWEGLDTDDCDSESLADVEYVQGSL